MEKMNAVTHIATQKTAPTQAAEMDEAEE